MHQGNSRGKHAERGGSGLGSFVFSVLFLCVVGAPLAASGANLTGTWDVAVDLPAEGCRWAGEMSLLQTGTAFTGSAALTRVAGVACPPTLSGMLSGTVSGSAISFGLASGEFGNASFAGMVSPDDQSATGTWFADPLNGTWTAQKRMHPAPALSGLGIVALFGLLTAAGVLCVRRRVI